MTVSGFGGTIAVRVKYCIPTPFSPANDLSERFAACRHPMFSLVNQCSPASTKALGACWYTAAMMASGSRVWTTARD
jgi:hypothetical protein